MSDLTLLFSQKLKKYFSAYTVSHRRQFILLTRNPDEAVAAERNEWAQALEMFETRGWEPCLIGAVG